MDQRPFQQPAIVPEASAEGRRFIAVGTILIAGSVPFIGFVLTFLGKRMGMMAWVLVAAMLIDVLLGTTFIVIGRKKMKQQQLGPGKNPPGWGKG